jgi:hypothetical protein
LCWLIIEVDSVFELLHDVAVGDVADILEVHAVIVTCEHILACRLVAGQWP